MTILILLTHELADSGSFINSILKQQVINKSNSRLGRVRLIEQTIEQEVVIILSELIIANCRFVLIEEAMGSGRVVGEILENGQLAQ